jgi:phosphatidylglycerol lysyltransferase
MTVYVEGFLRMKKLLQRTSPFIGLIPFLIALWALYHVLRKYHYHDVIRSLGELPTGRVVMAVLLTIVNYLALTGYDTLAFRYIRHPLHYGRIAFASFISYVFGHNVGFSILGSGTVRYRLYSAWGLSALEIAQVVAFCTLTSWLGLFTLGGLIFLLEPLEIPDLLRLPFASIRLLGVILIGVVGGYLLWSALRKNPLKIKEWELPIPSLRISIPQTAIAAMDWTLAGTVFYALLPPSAGLSFPTVLSVFLLAQIAGLVSHVPGGLGVFEAVVLHLLSPVISASSVLGSLLAYRVVYYLLPLMIGATLLGTHEMIKKKKQMAWVVRVFGQRIPELVPQVLALTTFVGGAVLLFSGATPTLKTRLGWLEDLIPLPVMEISHFLGSLAGLGLLLLARGLQQRLDAAYFLTALLLGAGAIFSLLKGLDYEEAATLGLMLISLVPCRRYFYRKASFFSERFTPGWIAAIALVLLGSVWIGLFSYKHMEYSGELWWQFSLSGDAPRFLRATVGVISLAVFFGVARLLRPAPLEPAPPNAGELEKAHAVVRESRKTYAHLALLGDKSFLFNDGATAFIMYAIEGRSWAALGDPVGPDKEMVELVWRFRALCDRHGGWTVFYQVSQEHLHLYLDLGLALLKLGEEGRILLSDFSMEGAGRREFRHIQHKLEREGCTFELVPPERTLALLPELKNISDAWLAEKNTREKRFSLGFFHEPYLKEFPISIVRKEGRIVAFANILCGAQKEEISVDLIRYLPEAPYGVMDYLLTRIILWGKQTGYQWFNLGMAPLSGLENRPLAPLWSKIGAFVFQHGEHFYNFQGLRQYKEKFDPRWEPRYLASPGGLSLPRIFTDLASLIAGGLKGIVSK